MAIRTTSTSILMRQLCVSFCFAIAGRKFSRDVVVRAYLLWELETARTESHSRWPLASGALARSCSVDVDDASWTHPDISREDTEPLQEVAGVGPSDKDHAKTQRNHRGTRMDADSFLGCEGRSMVRRGRTLLPRVNVSLSEERSPLQTDRRDRGERCVQR